MKNKVEEVTFHSAEELHTFLSPVTGNFTNRRWLFRGLPDASYSLTPTSLRKGSWETMNRIAGRELVPRSDSTSLQLFYEFNVLARFYAEVDAQGLPVADDSPEMRGMLHRPAAWAISYFKQLIRDQSSWPPQSLRGLAALAQHHGLPTRLLDWSYDPFVACFFACKGCSGDGQLVIWAIDSYAIERSGGKLEIVTAPAASNPNLQAQRGVFTLNPFPLDSTSTFEPLTINPVDELIQHVQPIDSPLMFKLCLPKSEAGPLFRLINRQGYNSSSLFPGYKGAADAVLENALPLRPNNWQARITMLVPESQLTMAKTAAALVDPETNGHRTFEASRFIDQDGDRYFAMSTAAPMEAAPLLRQVAESLDSVFFFQQSASHTLLDTNTGLELGICSRALELIKQAGFQREEGTNEQK